jgi:hypothetical protein
MGSETLPCLTWIKSSLKESLVSPQKCAHALGALGSPLRNESFQLSKSHFVSVCSPPSHLQ